MSLAGVVALCLGSAAFFSVATALKHRSAGEMPHVTEFRPGPLLAFARATLQHPLWLAGLLCDVGGFALQVVALHVGSLIVVQLVLMTAVLFSLVVSHRLAGTRISGRELALGAALVVSIIAFLLSSGALDATPDTADRLPAVLAAVAIVAGVVSLVAVSRVFSARKWRSRRAAAMLGVAVGAIYAGTAALIKVCGNIVSAQGVPALLTTWPLYALLVAGASGLLLAQMAFQAGPLAASLPATATADPLVSVLLGVVVFDEQLRTGAGAVLLTLVSLIALCAAVAALSQVRAVAEQPPMENVATDA